MGAPKFPKFPLVERTQSGLLRANAEGKTLGRPTKTNVDQHAEIVNVRKSGVSISALSRTYGISWASVMRVIGDL